RNGRGRGTYVGAMVADRTSAADAAGSRWPALRRNPGRREPAARRPFRRYPSRMRAQEYETWPATKTPPPLAELPAVSWAPINRAQARFQGHTHPAYELVYVVRGRMDN